MNGNSWGRELRAARTAEGDSQLVAAGKLGIDRGYLSNLELEKYDPSVETARRAWEVYRVPLRLLESPPAAKAGAEPAEERREGTAA